MMSFRRFIRNFLSVCGTDTDVTKHDYMSVSVKVGDEALPCFVDSCLDEEIAPLKRRRAMTLETERSSCFSDRSVSMEADVNINMSMLIRVGSASIELAPQEGPTDPITLEPLRDPKYLYNGPSGRVIEYNLSSIVEFLLATGDFRDPISRAQLTLDEVQELEDSLAKHDLKYPSLIERYHDKSLSHKMETDINTIRGLESCIGEIIVDILANVEKPSKSGLFSISALFSEVETPFQELKRLNIEAAYQALQSWRAFIIGPPKKPTRDKFGRLNFATSFLDSLWTAEDQSKLDQLRLDSKARLKEEPL